MTILFGGAAAAHVGELVEYQRSAATLGMGGVYLPFVSATDAVMWNPAVLAEVEKLDWEIFDFGLGANGLDVINLYNDVQKSGCSGSACYNSYYGVPVWITAGIASKFAAPRLGFTAYKAVTVSGVLHNPAFPTFNMTYLNDYGFEIGYGFPILANLNGGVTVKRINRWGGQQDIGLSTITSGAASIESDFNQRGTGYGFDLGLQYKLPIIPTTTFAASWQDVGSTAFIAETGSTSPPAIVDNFSVGLGSMIDLPGLDLKAGIEYRHINTQGEQLGKKLHIGGEVGLPLIDIRAGLNQGYPTLGVGLDLFFLRVDATQYTEETGVYPGQTPSARYKLSLSMDISVDADFKLTDKYGKKRSLKQRR